MTLQDLERPSAPQSAPGLIVTARVTGQAQILCLSGELDLATCEPVARALRGPGHSRPTLVLDLSELAFIDSSGLNLLLSADRAARATGRSVVLAGPSPTVRRTFELTGLDEILSFSPDVESALEAA